MWKLITASKKNVGTLFLEHHNPLALCYCQLALGPFYYLNQSMMHMFMVYLVIIDHIKNSIKHTIRKYSSSTTFIKPVNLFLSQKKNPSKDQSSNLKKNTEKISEYESVLLQTNVYEISMAWFLLFTSSHQRKSVRLK